KLYLETDADLVIGDDIPDGVDDGSRIAFVWKTESKKYLRSPSKDKDESD
ncbi:Replication protein, partial [Enterobacter hormaechei subsp. steigerwaltii]|nr:Replication protein [Enterobacter hormaechei subsp. steigerwaltii]